MGYILIYKLHITHMMDLKLLPFQIIILKVTKN